MTIAEGKRALEWLKKAPPTLLLDEGATIEAMVKHANRPCWCEKMEMYCRFHDLAEDEVSELFELLGRTHDDLANDCSRTDVRRRLAEFLGIAE